MTVELGLENATSGTYCLDDSTPVTYTGKTTIRIGSDYKYGETINLTLTATDGTKTTTTTYSIQSRRLLLRVFTSSLYRKVHFLEGSLQHLYL